MLFIERGVYTLVDWESVYTSWDCTAMYAFFAMVTSMFLFISISMTLLLLEVLVYSWWGWACWRAKMKLVQSWPFCRQSDWLVKVEKEVREEEGRVVR